jgi:hypothetical protein
MKAPRRHAASPRNRRKALHFAKNAHEELEFIGNKLRKLLDVHMRYALGRTARIVNRLEAEVEADHD